ncbi:MAG: hydroxymethylglutaryl-CoA reductase, degradative [Bacteroidales bacterium]|nr:hydroxymethylglutaryl-CoA reductase, degradative [Bacteroidales bacterium]
MHLSVYLAGLFNNDTFAPLDRCRIVIKKKVKNKEIICGFSKFPKEEKIVFIASHFNDKAGFRKELESFFHGDPEKQKLFDEFSENTLTNYYMPYGIAPNFLIDNKIYHIPMVIEESSVVAAAAKTAKFWSGKGGFHNEIISVEKIGQVHFFWKGSKNKLFNLLPDLKKKLLEHTEQVTSNMRNRGGGILDIELVDKTDSIPDYFQLKATFNTVDSMGANFINSVLEEFAVVLQAFFQKSPYFSNLEREVEIVMSILSNYTPNCLINTWIECDIDQLSCIDEELTGEEFAVKFEKAVKIANADTYRAATHNKGILNGMDAVVLATGNDFRAVEASAHAFAARNGSYKGLTEIDITNGRFKYSMTVPLSVGTVGGLTTLHPLAKISLKLLNDPNAEDLMKIISSVGLANNFAALKSLITKGIQSGHMKMHLLNILNKFNATDLEKKLAEEYFENIKISFNRDNNN